MAARRPTGRPPRTHRYAMIGRILPHPVVTTEAFADLAGEPPYPGEEHLIANAVERRRAEFVTARRCARTALGTLGHPPCPIGVGPRREPLWPDGFTGSITHCQGYRAAAVARRADRASIGIDAEPHAPLPGGVLDSVSTAGERNLLQRLDPATHWGRLLFSAKESVYKAWYPLTGRWLDFTEAELDIDPQTGTFTARLLIDGTRIDLGPPLNHLTGRYLISDGLVITTVTVPAAGGT